MHDRPGETGGVGPSISGDDDLADAPLLCVLSKVSLTLELGLALAVSCCGTFGASPGEVKGATPGEAACATPGEIKNVTPDDDDTPASCRSSVPDSEDESPGPGDEGP